jgi:hypothetical protein
MNEKITVRLTNGQITELNSQSAKIAISHLGATEIKPPMRPSEIGTKTKPPIINKPIPIVEPVIEEIIPTPEKTTVKELIDIVAPVKKTRKKRVASKSK